MMVCIYTGQWNEEKNYHERIGIIKYNNNSIYKGNWKNGKKYGIGIYKDEFEYKYQGNWINDKLENFKIEITNWRNY